MSNASRDQNRVTVIMGTSSTDGITPVPVYADEVTHRLLTDMVDISSHIYTDTFTSTNGQTTFTVTNTPTSTIYMSVNGSIQRPTTDYTQSGKNYVLTNGIPSGNDVVIVYTY